MRMRHYARYAVNGPALLIAVAALPELGGAVPVDYLPVVAGGATVLNTDHCHCTTGRAEGRSDCYPQ